MINAIFLGMIIPLAFLIVILKEDSRTMMGFFSWGLIAFILSLTVNTFLAETLGLTAEKLSITWGPIVEEFFKALPLIYFLFTNKNNRYSILHYAMAAGIGFSIIENYMYLSEVSRIADSPILYILLRTITTSLMHGISTAIIGYGLPVLKRFGPMSTMMLFGLFTLAVTLHALFNLYISSSFKLIAIIMPILLYFIGVAFLIQEESNG